MAENYGQIFTGELELCSEDSIIISGELFLAGNNFSNFLRGSPCYTCEAFCRFCTREIHSLSRD